MIALNDAKLFLRIDDDAEDNLLSSLITASQELVEGVLRQNLSNFDPLPECIKQAILFCISTMYEERQISKEGLYAKDMLEMVKRLTFAYRKESW